jgi:hypothetical protein
VLQRRRLPLRQKVLSEQWAKSNESTSLVTLRIQLFFVTPWFNF